MKFVLGFCLVLSTLSYAQPAPMQGANFEEHKNFALKMIDERMASLQSAKTCISAAQDQEQLKECRKKEREAMRGRRGEHLDNRIEKLQEKKAKMNEKP